MTRTELRQHALPSIRLRALALEQEVGKLFAEFPEVFSAKTAPSFVLLETKTNGNDWPAFNTKPKATAKPKQKRQYHRRDESMTDQIYRVLAAHPNSRPREIGAALKQTSESEQGSIRSLLSFGVKAGHIIKRNGRYLLPTNGKNRRPKKTPLGYAAGVKMDFWEYLRAHGRSHVKDAAKELGKSESNLIAAAGTWIKAGIIKRVAQGTYEAGPRELLPPPPPELKKQ